MCHISSGLPYNITIDATPLLYNGTNSAASPPGLELVLDAVLEALAADLHRGEHQAVAHEVRRVAHAFTRLEAASKNNNITSCLHSHRGRQRTRNVYIYVSRPLFAHRYILNLKKN